MERVDPSGLLLRLLPGLSPPARAGLRKLLSNLYQVGLKDGVDRVIELGIEEESEEPSEELSQELSPPPLRSAVQAVIDRYRRSELRLPNLSSNHSGIIRCLLEPDLDLEELILKLRSFPSLSVKVVALSASPFFSGGAKPPRSLNQAIVRLGTRELSRFLMVECNRSLFAFKTRNAEIIHQLWQHSLMTGLLAEQLAFGLEGLHPQSAFLHGLLHDIGKAVLLQIFDELEGQYSEEEIEQVIGGLHARFGATLLKRWRFDDSFCQIVLKHHESQGVQSSKLLDLLKLANHLAHRQGFGEGEEEIEEFCQALDLQEEQIESAVQGAMSSFKALRGG